MKRILISVLSDYLQPNFLLIKELEGEYDELIFITTEIMESKNKKKSYWLSKALKLGNEAGKIVVEEDDYEAVVEALNKEQFSSENQYIVNLTGGTKVMSIAVHDYFSKFNPKFYYVPIGKNEIKSINSKEEGIPLKYRMNLVEYFSLYGLSYKCDNNLTYKKKFTKQFFTKFKDVNFNRSRVPEIIGAQTLANPSDRRYYGGVWFEEYAYSRLKEELGLNDGQICKSAKIFRETSAENDNEIDVMYVKDNLLHIFECKVTMSGQGPNKSSAQTIEAVLYKLAAVSKDFGLRVNSYLLTLQKIKNNEKNFSEKKLELLEKRKSILGIKAILDSSDFKQQKLSI